MTEGTKAFDRLAEDGHMEVNDHGWGRITSAPRKKDKRAFAEFIRDIKTLGSNSTDGGSIRVERGNLPEEILFRKLSDR